MERFSVNTIAKPLIMFIEKLLFDIIWSRQRMYRWVAWHLGDKVKSGFFKGMYYLPYAEWGNPGNKLLGTYERELLTCWEDIDSNNPRVIFNIGAAEGYYAVGFASKWMESEVYAWESDNASRRLLLKNALANTVNERIHLLAKCLESSLFEMILQKSPDLILIDVEGDEQHLCSDRCIKSELNATWVIECHDESIVEILMGRFLNTHKVSLVSNEMRSPSDAASLLPRICLLLPKDFDRLVDEGRPIPTPWLIASPRKLRV